MAPPSPASLRETYARDGFHVAPSLIDPALITAAVGEADALVDDAVLIDRKNLRVRWTRHLDTDAPLFELFDPIVDLSPACKAIAESPALLDALRAVLGDEPVLVKDKLIFKPPGTVGYPLHQDFIAWPGFPEGFTTALIALDAAGPDSGPVEVFRGAHARGCLAERDGSFHMLHEDTVAGFERVPLHLQPGDVAIFGGFMPHRSAPNRSAQFRRHMLISYAPASDPGEPRAAHYRRFHHYLRAVYGSMGLANLHFR